MGNSGSFLDVPAQPSPGDDVQDKMTFWEGLPRSSRDSSGRYFLNKEVFPDFEEFVGLRNVLKWLSGTPRPPKVSEAELNEKLPVLAPNFAALNSPPANEFQVTWLGHATVLAQFDGWNILTDPIFSERCSAVQWAGPKRYRPVPLQTQDLPRIDAIVISHNHYDHLDKDSVQALARLRPPPMWFVPLGMKEWMAEAGVANVVEMDWSNKATLQGSTDRPDLQVTCAPCQHWCARAISDRNRCLWASFLCSTPRGTLYFGGDTGYCPGVFSKIGEIFSNIALAAIPIGAYGCPEERWFMKPHHMNCEEAAKTHQHLGSRQSVGIHWGTFSLTSEHPFEPPERLAQARIDNGIPDDKFVTLKHGETRVFDVLDKNPRK
eukprot:c1178_g1_i1.p1 GENE.c1178_g1_i1~~c1178_g1_i1.p1  ORF type:complete len:377 (+),score=74.41 c1178_g1_i1:32-1162(+)